MMNTPASLRSDLWMLSGRNQWMLSIGITGGFRRNTHPGRSFEFGASQPLFTTGIRFLTRYSIWMNQYAVSRDGQRFLLNRHFPEAEQSAITAVIPW